MDKRGAVVDLEKIAEEDSRIKKGRLLESVSVMS